MSTVSEDKVPIGPRSNPLFGGRSPSATSTHGGARTPSWARRSAPSPRHSAFSDVASTPPDSPARDNFGPNYGSTDFDYPYTVETPGRSEANEASPYHRSSPYHAPPYYVQTPAQSDPGAHSPFSSAPSSPAHYQYGSDSDTRSHRSARVGRPSRFAQQQFNKIDEEDEEYADPERDRQRREKQFYCTIWTTLFFLILLVGLIALILWDVYEPQAPKYKYMGAQVQYLDVYAASTDGHGVVTSTVYGNITAYFSASNPNSDYKMGYDSGLVRFGYSNLVILEGEVEKFNLPKKTTLNLAASAAGYNYPLYGAGSSLLNSVVNDTFVNLTMYVKLKMHVDIFWRFVKPKYVEELLCTVGVNSTTLQIINDTCTSPFKRVLH